MIGKTMRALVLSIASIGLLQSSARGAEALPPRALAQIGDHRFYHGPGIGCAVLSPDGKRVASAAHYPSYYQHLSTKERADYDPIIVLWDGSSGERLRELCVPHAPISSLAFSPDGKRLAAACGGGVVVFQVETGKLLHQFGNFDSVNGLSFSADGKQLRASEWGGPVSAWDAATGKQLRLWKPPALRTVWLSESNESARTKAVEFTIGADLSADGKFIAWHLWQLPDDIEKSEGNLLRRLPTVLIVCDAVTEKPLYRKIFDAGCPTRFAFSPNGRRFLRFTTAGERLALWETSTGKELFPVNAASVRSFALAANGRHAAIEEGDSRICVWDLHTGKPSPEFDLAFASIPSATQVFTAAGKALLLATDSTLRLFDATTGKERALFGHRAAVTPRFSTEGRTLFTTCAERIHSWDVSEKEPALLRSESRKTWESIRGQKILAHSDDGRLFLDRVRDRVRVRETATGRIIRVLEGHNDDAIYGRFAPDASRLLLYHYCQGAKPNAFRLHDAQTGNRIGEIKPVDEVGRPVFSANGRLLAWTDRGNAVHLHDAATGNHLRTLRSSRPLPKAECSSATLLFSPGGEMLVIAADLDYSEEGNVTRHTQPTRVFDVSSGRELARFYANPEKKGKAGPLWCQACSPDGRLLAVAEKESGTIRLLEITGGKLRVEFAGHRHGVHGLAFAPDGKTLASGGEDNVVFLWDVTGAKTPTVKPAREIDMASLWNDLASEDGKRAGIAIACLLRKPEASVTFLQEKLHPAEAMDEKRLAQLLADLDNNSYEKRETASRELVRLGERAEAALRRELTNRPSLEVRRRIEDVLSKLEPSPLPPEMLRTLRAIEVLEHIGTPAARRCLEALVKGAAETRETREIKAALRRLEK